MYVLEMRDWRTANEPTLARVQVLVQQQGRSTNRYITNAVNHDSFRKDAYCGRIPEAEFRNQHRTISYNDNEKRSRHYNDNTERTQTYAETKNRILIISLMYIY